MCRDAEGFLRAIRAGRCHLIVVDLACSVDDVHASLAAARAVLDARKPHSAARILAFGSHVDRDGLTRAAESGADLVLPRSRFVTTLDDILLGASCSRRGPDSS